MAGNPQFLTFEVSYPLDTCPETWEGALIIWRPTTWVSRLRLAPSWPSHSGPFEASQTTGEEPPPCWGWGAPIVQLENRPEEEVILERKPPGPRREEIKCV